MDVFVKKYQPEIYELWRLGMDQNSRNINDPNLILKRKRNSNSNNVSAIKESKIKFQVAHNLFKHLK